MPTRRDGSQLEATISDSRCLGIASSRNHSLAHLHQPIRMYEIQNHVSPGKSILYLRFRVFLRRLLSTTSYPFRHNAILHCCKKPKSVPCKQIGPFSLSSPYLPNIMQNSLPDFSIDSIVSTTLPETIQPGTSRRTLISNLRRCF